jgi:hypothetical protein
MAIHVKELVIRANVGTPAAVPSGSEQNESASLPSAQVVQAAVAEMLRILKDKKNR